MNRILFALTALLVMTASASAQYYPLPGQPYGGYYDERPRYRQPPPPPYWGGGGYYRERPVAFGNVCITSRGNCRTRPQPDQTPCSCFIPGFGPKRGAVSAGW